MKKLTLLAPGIMLLFTLLFFNSSCRKNEKILKNHSANSKHLADFENLPEIEDGIMVFSDQEHYNEWLEYLDECVGLDTIGTDTTDIDTTTTEEIFDEIEFGLSFNSLRKSLRTEFNALNISGWATLDEIPVMHFIGDQSVLSTLNVYGEVKIGDNVINYLDKDHIVIIKNSDFILPVRSFKTSGYSHAAEIFELDDIIQGTDVALEYVNSAEVENSSMNKPTGGDLSQIDGTIIKDPCNERIVKLDGYYLYYTTSVLTDYYIQWGDGTTSNVQTSRLTLTHNYSSFGSYTIRIYGTPSAGSGHSGTYDWRKDIICGNGCRKDSRNSGYVWKTTSPGNARCTRDYVSVSMIKGSLKRIYASTEAYEWTGSTWKTVKADRLKAQSCMEVLNFNTCLSWYNHCDQTEHKTDKFVQCGFNVSTEFGWNVAYSNHDIKYSNNWYNHYLQLNPCP